MSTLALSTVGINPASAQNDVSGEVQDEALVATRLQGEASSEPFQEEPHLDFTADTSEAEIRVVTNHVESLNAATLTSDNDPSLGDVDFSSAAGDYTIQYMPADASIPRVATPESHKPVFEAVMEEWASSVDFNGGGIHVQVNYQSLGSGALAGASHFSVIEGPSGNRYAIPTALRNADRGSDQFPSSPDIIVYVNRDQNWSTVMGASIGNSQYSLYATLLHEIGHGLGFSSDVDPFSQSNHVFSALDQRYYRDAGTSTSAGPSSPVRTVTSPLVTTGNHWLLNLDGTWERIYDPTNGYQNGSSMSHFDEATYPAYGPGALMSPTLFNGETVAGIDGVVLGAMEIVGWTVETPPVAPAITSTSVVPGQFTVVVNPSNSSAGPPAAGWTVTVTNASGGVVAASSFAATDRALTIPVHLNDGSYTVSVTGTGSGGSSTATTLAFTASGQGEAPTYTNCRQAPVNPAFSTSSETNASVYRLYCSYFLRYPDQSGFSYWLGQFSSGSQDLNEISEFFAISTEFNTRYGSLSDTEFVDLIYTNILEREPEATGYNFWVGELTSGRRSRGWLMLFFSQSDEFRIKTGTN